MRTEAKLFSDLAALCISKGFIHALAAICFRDTVVGFSDELKTEHLESSFSPSSLIRTEITTLIGLMMLAPIDFSLPDQQVLSDYIEHAEALLEELHKTMLPPPVERPRTDSPNHPVTVEFTFGSFLRETIFYSGESAYPFQYRDLAARKYLADSDWLLTNKAVKLDVGTEVCRSIADILNKRLFQTLSDLRDKSKEQWTMLPGFIFSCDEIASRLNKPIADVRSFVEAFTLPDNERNTQFDSLNAFNVAYACPFIRKSSDEFVLLQYYGVSEAFYETPFYWMCADASYADDAFRHRGNFTEGFAAERLSHVFGSNRVFKNVEIVKTKGEVLGEIDVLVTFGNQAVVLQAKSKKLTLEARKGNDHVLHKDFTKAVQDAVDQSFTCASLLADPSVSLRCRDGRTVAICDPPPDSLSRDDSRRPLSRTGISSSSSLKSKIDRENFVTARD